jgi:uncharacterized protein (DUF488 family)
MITIYTIGFAGKTEDEFYKILRDNGVQKIWDIRRWPDNVPAYFSWARGSVLSARCRYKYRRVFELAPPENMLSDYKAGKTTFDDSMAEFRALLSGRRVEELFATKDLDGACLMCSEKSAANCHRRIVAEYLAQRFPGANVVHL